MRVVWLWCYLAMAVGGVLSFILQMLYSPAVQFRFAALSVTAAAFGAFLLWADFLRPPPA
jgi:hypothetical protein